MARPVTLHVVLTVEQRADLHQRLRQPALSPRLRRRLECIRLADLGWPIPQIAAHLGVDQTTVRRAVHRLAHGGLDGLADRPRCGRPPTVTSHDLDALTELLVQAADRNELWTLAQLAGWLGHTAVPRSARTGWGCCCVSAAVADIARFAPAPASGAGHPAQQMMLIAR